ncbi:hypothetical protein, partial [Salmonella enterica]|uniref:hypothetical protein n=1 Tax=Salmonella enterica TaxID=28901 RepID=UPI003296CE36
APFRQAFQRQSSSQVQSPSSVRRQLIVDCLVSQGVAKSVGVPSSGADKSGSLRFLQTFLYLVLGVIARRQQVINAESLTKDTRS